MIPLPAFKKLLEEEEQNLTDEEVECIRNSQYKFAKLAFDKWAQERGLIGQITQKPKAKL